MIDRVEIGYEIALPSGERSSFNAEPIGSLLQDPTTIFVRRTLIVSDRLKASTLNDRKMPV